jgi:D-glycero-D-manno-heptose 1,7-bisphosphate phosphatase
MRRKVVFTDRDGVINRNSAEYIKRPDEFEFLPGSLQALQRLTEDGFDIIVITNQSALGRGWVRPETLAETHRRMVAAVEAEGGRILDIFICPHLPGDRCGCRKPEPGLLQAARRKHRLDFSSAVMIGDSAADIECALKAGVRTSVLVRTGNGAEAEGELSARGLLPVVVVDDLNRAAEWILRNTR